MSMFDRPLSSLTTNFHSQLPNEVSGWQISIPLNMPARSPTSFLKLSRAVNEVSPLTTCSCPVRKKVWWLQSPSGVTAWEMEHEKALHTQSHCHNPGTSWVHTKPSPLYVTRPYLFLFMSSGMTNVKQVDSPVTLTVSPTVPPLTVLKNIFNSCPLVWGILGPTVQDQNEIFSRKASQFQHWERKTE